MNHSDINQLETTRIIVEWSNQTRWYSNWWFTLFFILSLFLSSHHYTLYSILSWTLEVFIIQSSVNKVKKRRVGGVVWQRSSLVLHLSATVHRRLHNSILVGVRVHKYNRGHRNDHRNIHQKNLSFVYRKKLFSL